MKAVINDVKFSKEGNNKFGPYFSFKVSYDGKMAYYNAKRKDQITFVAGQEAEFTEEERTFVKDDGSTGKFLVIKPINANKQSNFGKALKKEQSRYSGFAVSYAKDLVIADKLKFEELVDYATILFNAMVEMDKTIDS
jgi:hypothetical protein